MSWGNPPTITDRSILGEELLFRQETFEKETDSRVNWFIKVRGKQPVEPTTGKVLRKKLTGGCPVPSEGIFSKVKDQKPADYRLRKFSYDDIMFAQLGAWKASIDRSIEDVMLPVDFETRSHLFRELSHHQEARHQYLKERMELPSEAKYRFSQTESSDLGWKLYDFVDKCDAEKSPHVNQSLMKKTFYTTNGIPILNTSAECKCAQI